ncbi:Cof-type HAD-IIB family hydrolase [Sphingomonas sp. PB2P19]|uniref:Cof-type HAD-IIB family hydrolase n=1 Tax=Sphingomonas rhamnosi TaxID=3096156 RepID=UPI002FCB61C7
MSIRLLVSDVDGTLVDKQKQVAPATVDAVARLKAAGIGFTIISARPRSGMMPIADLLGIDEPMGAFNGGIVFKRDGTVIEHHMIDETVARGAMAIIGDAPVDTWVFADDIWYASTDQGGHVGSERKASAQDPVIIADFGEMMARADKITFVSDDEPLLRDLHAKVAAQFGEQATIVQSQTYYLDITPLAGNKGTGIGELADAFGVPLAQTAAIGDQANDISMLKRAGLSIAMGNAPEAVRAVSHELTSANDADGVARAIDTFILGVPA